MSLQVKHTSVGRDTAAIPTEGDLKQERSYHHQVWVQEHTARG